MQIRRLSKKDVVMFKELRMEALKMEAIAFAADYNDEVNRDVSEYKNWLDTKIVYAVFDKDQMVAMSSFTWEREKKKLCHSGMIQSVYVKPEYRRKGLGTNLFKITLDNLPEEIEKVIIYVVKNNENAKSMYELLGFKEYGLEEKALKINNEYYDEYLMVKFIK